MTTSDAELLKKFSLNRSDDAFQLIVGRHINLVYSAALRQVSAPHLAEDVTQSVFIELSKKASSLKQDTLLSAWLFQVTRRTAIDVVRSESRRQVREQTAVELADMRTPDNSWSEIKPLLDEGMESLDESERNSLLLRYFEKKSFREVGQALGTGEDAAQKRVSRAVERLREFFSRRGVTVGSGALVTAVSAQAVQSAPAALLGSIIQTASAGGTIAAATVVAQGTASWLTAKAVLAMVVSGVIAGTAAYYVQQNRSRELAVANQNLIAQEQQLKWKRDAEITAASAASQELEGLRKNETELLKLRGEVGVLRRRTLEIEKLREENRELRSGQMTVSSSPTATAPQERIVNLNLCINNLLQIDGAMDQCALEHHYSTNVVMSAEEIAFYIRGQKVPQCPSGGTYTFGALSQKPTCSFPGHVLPKQFSPQ